MYQGWVKGAFCTHLYFSKAFGLPIFEKQESIQIRQLVVVNQTTNSIRIMKKLRRAAWCFLCKCRGVAYEKNLVKMRFYGGHEYIY